MVGWHQGHANLEQGVELFSFELKGFPYIFVRNFVVDA